METARMQRKEQDLDALEKDLGAAARGPDELEEVRSLMETLRRLSPSPDETGKVVPRFRRSDVQRRHPALQRPRVDFRELNISRIVRCLLGTIVFVVLCFSLILLAFPVGDLLQGRFGPETLPLLLMALSLVVLLSAVLYLLWRTPRAEREARRQDPIMKQFVRQKRLLLVSALSLVVAIIAVAVLVVWVFDGGPLVPLAALGALYSGGWLLSRRFWRCPACGWQLSFMPTSRDWLSMRHCPVCQARLQ
jgi:hypothetical protein